MYMYLPKEWGGEENKEEEEEVGHFQLSFSIVNSFQSWLFLFPLLDSQIVVLYVLCAMCCCCVIVLIDSPERRRPQRKWKRKRKLSLCVSKKRSDFLPPMTGCEEKIVNYSTFADLILPTATIHYLFLLPPFLEAALFMISWYKRSCVNQINDCHISLSDHIPVFVILRYSP